MSMMVPMQNSIWEQMRQNLFKSCPMLLIEGNKITVEIVHGSSITDPEQICFC